jgi:two-component system nitrate/nitrite response regulator NarL
VAPSQLDQSVTITLIEDQLVVVDGVRKWIADDPEGRVAIVSVGASIEEALKGPGRTADVIVLDLELAETGTAKTMATPRVAGLCAEGFRVVVFSIHYEPFIVQTVLEAGACAFLDKHAEGHRFVDTVVAVAGDQPVVTPSMAGGLLNEVRLSRREREVLQYLFQGMSYPSIARRLTRADGKPISATTVKDYVKRARAKFAAARQPCRSNYALLARCIELGLIRPEEIDDYRPMDYGSLR